MSRRVFASAVRLTVLLTGLVLTLAGRRSPASTVAEAPHREPGSSLWRLAKTWAFRAAVVLGAIALGGAVVVLSGIVPIKASSGHWAITAWFLDFAKSRSVSTHTLGMKVPPLDQPHQVIKGAGQYDYACRPCHGSPSLEQPRVAAQMTPTPPDLRASVPEYDPAALFYIVKHGIKLTGMPAWPARRRDDEVWAMVAFLRRLPGMDAQEYQRLASGPAGASQKVPMDELVPPTEVPEAVTDSCGRCHGIDGLGRGSGAFPVLAGQHTEYLRASLEAYAKGERHSGLMQPVAAALGRDDMQRIANYYAGLPPQPVNGSPAWDADLEYGKRIAHQGIPEKLVPACVTCHGPSEIPHSPHYPMLAGQYAEYLRLQLTLFKDRTRGGTPYHHIMRRVANQLTEDEMRAVAAYFATLPAISHSPRP